MQLDGIAANADLAVLRELLDQLPKVEKQISGSDIQDILQVCNSQH